MKVDRSTALQAVFVAALVAVLAAMASTAHDNLVRQGIATGFRFLGERTGWDVSASFLPHASADPYWWTFVVGLSNTIALSITAIVLATALGLVLALLGSGRSRILHGLTRLYIWLFRNVPLIVQVFFWYHVTRQFPPVRQATEILGCCYATNRGFYLPHIGLDATNGLEWSLPKLQGFNFTGGTHVSPEFIALVLAIVAYNVAFIAEIVNSGIRSVPRHQLEAARIIGLSDLRTFWQITVPQAIRVAVPPLINQYISLTKSSSLAIAIGYTDLFSVGVIAINHTGQSLDVVAVLMVMYLVVSLGISALGNLYNRRIAARGAR
jgi:His/Glu/Gln/Arg/opine family amino acid ABC transporter permease subunit